MRTSKFRRYVVPTIGAFDAKTHRHAARFGKYRRQAIKSNPWLLRGLVETLPSLEEHLCSPGCRGGFLMRVREGTMMGHIVEHVALEPRNWLGC